ncbi:hypothetical protein FO519_007411 [Halicephalobus sp. NKZ332]|nr:hypothetical protein FO519_007411 [Halicephalobus sp. NKZ332]
MSDLEKKLREHNLLVNQNKKGTYIVVQPTPGCVIKFKKAKLLFSQDDDLKCFVNLAHCLEVPGPDVDVDEVEMIKMMRIDSERFKLPLSLGELDCVKDKQEQNSLKFDVVINSDFYHKRFSRSEYHRQLTILALINQIEKEHQVRINRSSQVILKNKKVYGNLSSHMIPKAMRKEPRKPQIIDLMDIRRPFDINPHDNVQIWAEQGIQVKIRILVPEKKVASKDLRLEANDDHVVLLQKGGRRIADFFIPVDLDVGGLKAKIVEPPEEEKKDIQGTIVELTSRCVFPG